MPAEQDPQQAPEAYRAGYETFLSPLTSRYGSMEMRRIWSQQNFWHTVRTVWLAAAETQAEVGLVSADQLAELRAHVDTLSVEKILKYEKECGHDVAGAIREFGDVAPEGGKIVHQGMTSEDPLSNTEVLQIHESLGIIRGKLVTLLDAFGGQIDTHKDLVCMGYTHLQAAEPTTYGYRFAKYAQDLLTDLAFFDSVLPLIKGKGIKGAVGTSASFKELLEDTGMTPEEHERKVMEKLGLDYVTISDQTYPRKFLLLTEEVLGNIGQSLHRFALDLQILQSSFVDEVSEPRRKKQIGSSAMPHKRNPIGLENIDSITEAVPGGLFSAWMTASFVTLERTLRDSAGKRIWLPESFLIIDEALTRAEKIIRGLEVHTNSVETNLRRFAPFCVTEIILGKLTKAGMDRKVGHELLVENCEKAVEALRNGEPNPLIQLLAEDSRITDVIGSQAVMDSFDQVLTHVGDAPERCTTFLQTELYPAIGK